MTQLNPKYMDKLMAGLQDAFGPGAEIYLRWEKSRFFVEVIRDYIGSEEMDRMTMLGFRLHTAFAYKRACSWGIKLIFRGDVL